MCWKPLIILVFIQFQIICGYKIKTNSSWLGRAWPSPTLAWLHCAGMCVSGYAWTDHLPEILNQWIQIFHNECPRRRVLQLLELSRENECEGLLPDCRVGVKERVCHNLVLYWVYMYMQHIATAITHVDFSISPTHTRMHVHTHTHTAEDVKYSMTIWIRNWNFKWSWNTS